MANTDIVNGFTPVKHLNGSTWNGQVNYYKIPAADGTATFVGDIVKLYGTATAEGIPQVIQAAAADVLLVGAIVSFEPDPANLSLTYRTASTLRGCYVADSPDTVFEAQEDSHASTLALADVGENCDFVVAAGDTTTGKSGMEIDSSDHVATTQQIRILRAVQREGNTAASAHCKWECYINEHAYRTTAGF